MRSRPVEEWKDYNVTARDIVADGSMTVSFDCAGCRLITEFNIWKVGMVLADTPLQRMRFRCKRCGVYPKALKIGRRTSGNGDKILTVTRRVGMMSIRRTSTGRCFALTPRGKPRVVVRGSVGSHSNGMIWARS